MKVLSLWQPHATLVCLSLKTIETRSFKTNYRGLLAIHSTKNSPVESLALSVKEPMIRQVLLKHHQPFREAFKPCPLLKEAISGPRSWRVFPAGALPCVAELVDCLPTWGLAGLPLSNFRPSVFRRYPKRDTPQERAFGNYEPYRYARVLDNIQAMPTPIPYSGHQGLRDLEPAFEKRVLAALEGTK